MVYKWKFFDIEQTRPFPTINKTWSLSPTFSNEKIKQTVQHE